MNRATVYIVILGIACTGLGVAAGIGIEKRYTRRHLPQMVKRHLLRQREGLPFQRGRIPTGQAHRGQMGRERFLSQQGQRPAGANLIQRITRELDLSAGQKEKVQAVLQETRQQVKQARDEFKTQVEQAKEESNVQILEVLDPEQKEKFQELTTKMKEKELEKRRAIERQDLGRVE